MCRPGDRIQRVAHFVRNAGRHFSQFRQPACMLKTVSKPHFLGYVFDIFDHLDHAIAPVQERKGVDLDISVPFVAAVLVAAKGQPLGGRSRLSGQERLFRRTVSADLQIKRARSIAVVAQLDGAGKQRGH